jgi:hypothetical protein
MKKPFHTFYLFLKRYIKTLHLSFLDDFITNGNEKLLELDYNINPIDINLLVTYFSVCRN